MQINDLKNFESNESMKKLMRSLTIIFLMILIIKNSKWWKKMQLDTFLNLIKNVYTIYMQWI